MGGSTSKDTKEAAQTIENIQINGITILGLVALILLIILLWLANCLWNKCRKVCLRKHTHKDPSRGQASERGFPPDPPEYGKIDTPVAHFNAATGMSFMYPNEMREAIAFQPALSTPRIISGEPIFRPPRIDAGRTWARSQDMGQMTLGRGYLGRDSPSRFEEIPTQTVPVQPVLQPLLQQSLHPQLQQQLTIPTTTGTSLPAPTSNSSQNEFEEVAAQLKNPPTN